MFKILSTFFMLINVVLLAGCEPEIGSKAWCKDLDEQSKGDWTINEAKEYTKNCLFKDEE